MSVKQFRDTLAVDANFITSLNAKPGDTLVFGARNLSLSALLADYNYVLLADQLTVSAGAALTLVGTKQNYSPEVKVFARQITNALNLASKGCAGDPGVAGKPGEPGEPGETPGQVPGPIRKPKKGGPGGDGGNGGPGGTGAKGGNITVHYVSAAITLTANAPGGDGGPGGQKGSGGPGGQPGGLKGKDGLPGPTGQTGDSTVVDVRAVDAAHLWNTIDADAAAGWAAYRLAVAEYFFRKFDTASLLVALSELDGILLLQPQNSDAKTLRTRLIQQQTVTGLPRDMDIAPDYRDLSAHLQDEVNILFSAFHSFADATASLANAEIQKQQLSTVISQLTNRQSEAADNIALANQDIAINGAEVQTMDAHLKSIQDQIEALKNRPFSFLDILSTVGAIAGAIAGIATGAGAIVSIPASLAALGSLATSSESVIAFLKAKDAIDDLKKLGAGLDGVMKVKDGLVNFGKVVSDLESASHQAGQGDVGQLLQQQATTVEQKMIAGMRGQQGQMRLEAANHQLQDLKADASLAQSQLATWKVDATYLATVTDVIINAARRLADLVAEDAFLAARALEIYQLEPALQVRFDYGYLHPDDELGRSPSVRAGLCAASLTGLAQNVITWDQLFTRLNSAQVGFDVIHPVYQVTIQDANSLQHFGTTGGLEFEIGIDQLPAGMLEVKCGGMDVELVGARSTTPANIWVEHSGQWTMKRRRDQSLVRFNLQPHVETVGCLPQPSELMGSIPSATTNSVPGLPFSFWGRGLATKWRLYLANPKAIDLSGFKAINVTFRAIALASPAVAKTINLKLQQVVAPTKVPMINSAETKRSLKQTA